MDRPGRRGRRARALSYGPRRLTTREELVDGRRVGRAWRPGDRRGLGQPEGNGQADGKRSWLWPDRGRRTHRADSEHRRVCLPRSEHFGACARQGQARPGGAEALGRCAAKVPRNAVASADLGDGKITYPLTITFADGGQWDLEVA